jgi:predicted transposase/invertase (TIGR01784 family)
MEAFMENETPNFYPLTNDFMFKAVFGNRRNTDMLKQLLQTTLTLPTEELKSIKVLDPLFQRVFKKEKQSVLDVRLETSGSIQINVEMQVLKLKDFTQRIIYYLSKLSTDQIHSGDSYDKLKQSICVVIADHIVSKDNTDYINSFVFKNKKTNEIWTELQKVVIIELPKLPEKYNNTDAWEFFKCFTFKTEKEFAMFAKQHPKIKPLYENVKRLSLTTRLRMIAELREKARRDDLARLGAAIDEGREEMAKEMEAKTKEMVKKLAKKSKKLTEKSKKLAKKSKENEELKRENERLNEKIRQLGKDI